MPAGDRHAATLAIRSNTWHTRPITTMHMNALSLPVVNRLVRGLSSARLAKVSAPSRALGARTAMPAVNSKCALSALSRQSCRTEPGLDQGSSTPANGIPMEDWDLLFRAVVDRLAATIGARPSSSTAIQRSDASAHLRSVLLECADALEYLNAATGEWQAPSRECGQPPP